MGAHVQKSMPRVSDVHIIANTALPTPREMFTTNPRLERHASLVAQARTDISRVLNAEDDRFILVVGPCSIHDLKAGREYAERLAKLADEVKERVLIVMRVYFEKPRTTVGWKGLIMDPHLDGTNDIPEGFRQARRFLLDVIDLGLPTATEMLDPITPQYIADLICWSAIGARTTESQTHRQMASGLSTPVGFKNATSGAILPAINAIKAAMQPQTFLGIDNDGRASVVATEGNPDCHVILRGGDGGPNHDEKSIAETLALLQKHSLPRVVMADASHANCHKKQTLMPATYRAILDQRVKEKGLIGAMLESNLLAGAQSLDDGMDALEYGKSITDQCIDWATTEQLVRETAEKA